MQVKPIVGVETIQLRYVLMYGICGAPAQTKGVLENPHQIKKIPSQGEVPMETKFCLGALHSTEAC